jgi:hypothetical protein
MLGIGEGRGLAGDRLNPQPSRATAKAQRKQEREGRTRHAGGRRDQSLAGAHVHVLLNAARRALTSAIRASCALLNFRLATLLVTSSVVAIRASIRFLVGAISAAVPQPGISNFQVPP